MADKKDATPLLMEELSPVKKALLTQVVHHGGYKVVVELMDAACTRATQDIVKLNPEDANYGKLLEYRTIRARNISEFCALVLKSVDFHVLAVKTEEEEEKEQAVDAVAKTFGIHKVPPKPKKEPKK